MDAASTILSFFKRGPATRADAVSAPRLDSRAESAPVRMPRSRRRGAAFSGARRTFPLPGGARLPKLVRDDAPTRRRAGPHRMRQLNFDLKPLPARHREGVSITRRDRAYALDQAANLLHALGFRRMRATGLKRKHVNALVAEWQRRGLEARSFAGLMKKLGEARRATGETVNEILVEETDDAAAASLAAQWRERPGPGLDDRSSAAGTLVEVNGQFAFGGAKFGQDAFDGLVFGNVDGRGQARKECCFSAVGNCVRKVVGQRTNDPGAVCARKEHGAPAAPGHVGPVNEITVVEPINATYSSGEKRQFRLEVVERRESEPTDFDAFGDLDAFGGTDEVDAGLGQ